MATTFTFHRCLGRGGYGEVYLATRRSPQGLERRVAVKVLRPELTEADQALRRLRDEGRLLAVLEHPAILRVLELTRIKGRIALVTEYVEGVDLVRYCVPKRLLPPRVVAEVAAEVVAALDTAWRTPSPTTGKPLQLVHRDIKPENVRLSCHGEVKVLDFGIARSHELDREARTAVGNMPFTPGYAAPEAFVSLVQESPADVFALGATVFRALTGSRFYEKTPVAEQAALASSPARFARHRDLRLALLGDGELAAVVADCLQYDPSARPSAEELHRRLEPIADQLAGPSLRRWARAETFPPERELEGGALTGQVLTEDGDEVSMVFERPKVARPEGLSTIAPPPPASRAALSPSMVPPPLSSLPPPLSVPPPPPSGLVHVEPDLRESTLDRPSLQGDAPRPVRRPGVWWLVGIGLLGAVIVVVGIVLVLIATGVWMVRG